MLPESALTVDLAGEVVGVLFPGFVHVYTFYVAAHNRAGYSPTVAVSLRTAAPALYNCVGAGRRRQSKFNFACGDGNGYFDRARWTR